MNLSQMFREMERDQSWQEQVDYIKAQLHAMTVERDSHKGAVATLTTRVSALEEQCSQMRGDIKTTEDVLQEFDGDYVWVQAQNAMASLAALQSHNAELVKALCDYHRTCGHRNDSAAIDRWDAAIAALAKVQP